MSTKKLPRGEAPANLALKTGELHLRVQRLCFESRYGRASEFDLEMARQSLSAVQFWFGMLEKQQLASRADGAEVRE